MFIDEIMVAFHNDHASGWTFLDRNPHTLGNECYTVAFCETKIAFVIESVEAKDKSKEGVNSSPEFEEEAGSKCHHFIYV